MLKIATCILSTILVTVCANSQPLSNYIAGRADLSLANYLLEHQSRAASPASLQCFDIYLPVLQQTYTDWSVGYNNCLTAAEATRNDILDKASSRQKDISAEAENVCSIVQTCTSISDAFSALDCFSTLSSNTVSDFYALSNNASDSVAEFREQIYIIDANTSKCINATERTYVETTALIYDAIDDCLKNGLPQTVPPPTPPTTGATTPNALRNVQVVAAPRRTPVGRVLTKEPKEEDKNGVPQTSNFLAFKNWLQQNGNDGVGNI